MRITVIGAGAIGTLVATHLARAGVDVFLVVRDAYVSQWEGRELRVDVPGELPRVANVAVRPEGEAPLSVGETDGILVTVKAYDTAPLAERLRSHPSPARVLTLQNGVGNEEAFAQAVGEERVFSAALTTPVQVLEPGHVRVTRKSFKMGLAPVQLNGESQEWLTQVARAFSSQGFQVRVHGDYRALKWSKLLMNITANAQAALLGWPPARVFAHPVAGTLEVHAWKEALAVMDRLGVRPIPCGGYPLPLVTPFIRALPARWLRPLMGRFAGKGRGEKMPSVFLDLARGRKRTEVPWLNGAVARWGEQVGLATPVNRTLDRLVDRVARGDLPWAVVRDRPEFIATHVEAAREGG